MIYQNPDLEYGSLIHQIAMRCSSDLGKAIAHELRPHTDIASITKSQNLIAEIQELLEQGLDFNFEDLADLTYLFNEQAYSLYNWEEFRQIAQNADIAVKIHDKTDYIKEQPIASSIVKRIIPMADIMERFVRIFDPEGDVLDSASPELANIRRKTGFLRSRIQKTMQNLLSDSRLEHYLQDKFVTQREDRFVLPIKESATPFVNGIVQSHSSKGSTVFIEPAEVVPLNNELQLMKQEEKQEIYRIFSEFSKSIKARKLDILANQSILAELDFRFACGRFSNQIRAKVPKMQKQPTLNLISARHPLLILRNIADKGSHNIGFNSVIPFDLSLGDEYYMLILSGPNTGGKTVLMKAVGLITLMAMSGLTVPVDPDSEIGLFSNVFADIGDDQSIENALSTFSSHLDKIRRMLSGADEDSLVLIDEIGAATDPQQGSALAQAILERLTELRVKGIVTTHYTALKVFAESNEKCINASMQFDTKSLVPTYRFSTGIPGDSFAIEVAASLGMEPILIERARSLAGSQNMEFTSLIKRLQEEKKNLATKSYQFELQTRNLQARITDFEEKDKLWQAELKARRQKHLKELQTELISQQKLYSKELSELKTLDKDERKRFSERKLQEINNKTEELSRVLIQSQSEGKSRIQNPKAGMKVWLTNFETEAVILDVQGQSATVDMNGITFKTDVLSLYRLSSAAENVEVATPMVKTPAKGKVQTELKLLGLTFDEAMPLIDEFLDNAALTGFHTLRIVHGKGTGALRTKVRDYLRRKKNVLSIDTPPMFEGGSGVTVVKI